MKSNPLFQRILHVVLALSLALGVAQPAGAAKSNSAKANSVSEKKELLSCPSGYKMKNTATAARIGLASAGVVLVAGAIVCTAFTYGLCAGAIGTVGTTTGAFTGLVATSTAAGAAVGTAAAGGTAAGVAAAWKGAFYCEKKEKASCPSGLKFSENLVEKDKCYDPKKSKGILAKKVDSQGDTHYAKCAKESGSKIKRVKLGRDLCVYRRKPDVKLNVPGATDLGTDEVTDADEESES